MGDGFLPLVEITQVLLPPIRAIQQGYEQLLGLGAVIPLGLDWDIKLSRQLVGQPSTPWAGLVFPGRVPAGRGGRDLAVAHNRGSAMTSSDAWPRPPHPRRSSYQRWWIWSSSPGTTAPTRLSMTFGPRSDSSTSRRPHRARRHQARRRRRHACRVLPGRPRGALMSFDAHAGSASEALSGQAAQASGSCRSSAKVIAPWLVQRSRRSIWQSISSQLVDVPGLILDQLREFWAR